MPSEPRRSTASTDNSDYGAVFSPVAGKSALETGEVWVKDALHILANRLEKYRNLRAIPLTPSQRKTLIKRSIDFLQVNQGSMFEEDNLKHVGRLISNMKIHADTLKEFLDMDAEDIQLLAALHDLGKAKVPSEMLAYLTTVFGDDFLSLRVLPHELFSFYWIERLGTENGISIDVRQLLMDQVANHNLGPDLDDPVNQFLLEKEENGRYRHWWVEHWSHWSEKAARSGLDVSPTYGHTVSPLANALVLFDRIDGGNPHSWEKFLNQDIISGHLKFTAEGIIEVMEHANFTAKEQLKAVGLQLQKNFTEKHRKTKLGDFAPYNTARNMLDKNDRIVDRLKSSNGEEHFRELKADPKNSILYRDQKQQWQLFDAKGATYERHGNEWKLGKKGSNPIALLLDYIYQDWKS